MLFDMKKNRTRGNSISLYLHFLGFSLRNTYRAVPRFIKGSHSAFKDWIQKYKPEMSIPER
jgi:hypothetical protein